jgi:hypothetical protein
VEPPPEDESFDEVELDASVLFESLDDVFSPEPLSLEPLSADSPALVLAPERLSVA